VLLVPDEFSADDGSLTPTLNLRRKTVEERYREQIDELDEGTEIATVA
jgi:long-subunit acyl-CoA synthetase (AMP-forming)